MGNQNSCNPYKEQSRFKVENDSWVICSSGAQGMRATNEDEIYLAVHKGIALCCIFDGHDGTNISTLLRNHYGQKIVGQVIDQLDVPISVPVFQKKIQEKYEMLDQSFLEELKRKTPPNSKLLGGSTACCVYLCKEKVVTVNVGDSRAVLYRGEGVQSLSEDHKPSGDEERIESAGGKVVRNRIYFRGVTLGVSRAFGDFSLKDNDLSPHKRVVTCTPDVTVFYVQDGDFVVNACDGLWDVMSNREVGAFVRQYVQKFDIWDGKPLSKEHMTPSLAEECFLYQPIIKWKHKHIKCFLCSSDLSIMCNEEMFQDSGYLNDLANDRIDPIDYPTQWKAAFPKLIKSLKAEKVRFKSWISRTAPTTTTEKLTFIADELVDFAMLHRKSKDNVSVTIAFRIPK